MGKIMIIFNGKHNFYYIGYGFIYKYKIIKKKNRTPSSRYDLAT